MSKICNIIFWIENGPPFGTFSKIHPFWYFHPSLSGKSWPELQIEEKNTFKSKQDRLHRNCHLHLCLFSVRKLEYTLHNWKLHFNNSNHGWERIVISEEPSIVGCRENIHDGLLIVVLMVLIIIFFHPLCSLPCCLCGFDHNFEQVLGHYG